MEQATACSYGHLPLLACSSERDSIRSCAPLSPLLRLVCLWADCARMTGPLCYLLECNLAWPVLTTVVWHCSLSENPETLSFGIERYL